MDEFDRLHAEYEEKRENEAKKMMENQVKEEKIIKLPVSNLAGALCQAQAMMSGAKKDKKNPFFKSSYADMASVLAAIREPFGSHGLSVTQVMDISDAGTVLLRTRLMHESGEYIDSVIPLPIDSSAQKTGINITYYRRYTLMAICGLAPVDDDANSTTVISPKQVAQLEDMMKDHPVTKEKLLNNCKGDLHNLTLDRFPGAVQWINELIAEKSNV